MHLIPAYILYNNVSIMLPFETPTLEPDLSVSISYSYSRNGVYAQVDEIKKIHE